MEALAGNSHIGDALFPAHIGGDETPENLREKEGWRAAKLLFL
jgi:hypothetical protein